MNWEKLIPRWGGTVVEPPEQKKTDGWLPGDKPPAFWENWFRKGVSEALEETQDNVDLCGDAIKGITGKTEVTDIPDITLAETKAIADDFIAHKQDYASSETLGHLRVFAKEDATANTTTNNTFSNTSLFLDLPAGMAGKNIIIFASGNSDVARVASGTGTSISADFQLFDTTNSVEIVYRRHVQSLPSVSEGSGYQIAFSLSILGIYTIPNNNATTIRVRYKANNTNTQVRLRGEQSPSTITILEVE